MLVAALPAFRFPGAVGRRPGQGGLRGPSRASFPRGSGRNSRAWWSCAGLCSFRGIQTRDRREGGAALGRFAASLLVSGLLTACGSPWGSVGPPWAFQGRFLAWSGVEGLRARRLPGTWAVTGRLGAWSLRCGRTSRAVESHAFPAGWAAPGRGLVNGAAGVLRVCEAARVLCSGPGPEGESARAERGGLPGPNVVPFLASRPALEGRDDRLPLTASDRAPIGPAARCRSRQGGGLEVQRSMPRHLPLKPLTLRIVRIVKRAKIAIIREGREWPRAAGCENRTMPAISTATGGARAGRPSCR